MRRGLAVALSAALATQFCTRTGGDAPEIGRFAGQVEWDRPGDWFGGFSGLTVDPEGGRFLALSDRAVLVEGRFVRRAGEIVRIRSGRPTRLTKLGGMPLSGREVDSEGLTVAPGGRALVSFEQTHSIRPLAHGRLGPTLPTPAAFQNLRNNGSLESLATAPDGSIWTVPEFPGRFANTYSVFVFRGGAWHQPFSLPRRGGFRAVGADFGPDGRFYLLERRLTMLGFQSRLRRWTFGPTGPAGEQLVFRSAAGQHANLEGVAVWRRGTGALVATMISDDNFLPIQRTQIVEYAMPE